MQNSRSGKVLALCSLFLLGAGCLLVLWPFLTALAWAAILASTSWPALVWLDRRLGQRRILSASLMILLVTLVLLVPIVAVAVALADNATELAQAAGNLASNGLPDAPAWLVDVPLVGPAGYHHWQRFAHDGQRLMIEVEKLLQPAQGMVLTGGRMVAKGVVDVTLSVFLAFFFFLHGEALARRMAVALEHLAGARATYLLGIAQGTVSGVIYGILGTALAQGVLATIGFAIASVPGAVLLGVATFFLSVVPVGPPLVWGGAALWLFQQGAMGWAIFVAAWGFFIVSTVDNVLKPFIISRGASLPFAIVFLGVLGGVLAFGVIGVFLGPALLAVGYRLLREWTTAKTDAQEDGADG